MAVFESVTDFSSLQRDRVVLELRKFTDDLDPRPVGRHLKRRTAPPRNPGPALSCARSKLTSQSGFTDARLTHQRVYRSLSREQFLKSIGKISDFRVSPHTTGSRPF